MRKCYLLFTILFFSIAQFAVAQGIETFDNIPVANPTTSYGTRQWVGNGGVAWTATDARTDLTITGKAILIRNGSLTANNIPNGIGNLSFKHQQEFTGSNPVLQVYVNNILVGSANPTNTMATATLNNINVSGTFNLEIRQITTGLRIKIDDLTWTAYSSTPCVTPSAQATNMLFSGVTTSSVQLNFTAASPVASKYLVLISASPGGVGGIQPVNGTVYAVGDNLGTYKVAGYGSGVSYSITGLLAGTDHYVVIYPVNDQCSGEPFYGLNSPLAGMFTTGTPLPCTRPLSPSGLQLTPSQNQVVVSYSAPVGGTEQYIAVFGIQPLAGWLPQDGITYLQSQAVGNASVAYIGANTTFNIPNLNPATQYYVNVFSFNGIACTGGTLYGTPSLSGQVATTNNNSNIPSGYYDTITGKTCADLKSALAWRANYDLAKNVLVPKTYGDLWIQYLISDVKPREVGTGSANVIWDMYSDNPNGLDPYNFTPGPVSGGGQQDNGGNAPTEGIFYNREHSVPLSWFSGSTGTPGEATDYLHIVPTDKWVNALRDSYIFGEVTNPATTSFNGSKLGPNAFSGLTGTAFEPIDAYKGDLARAFLYFVTRYQDKMPSFTGGTNGTQAFDPTLYPSVDIPYLRLMLKWHQQDPVSEKERNRNDAAYTFQGNRNPFVDLPELGNLVWNDQCGIILPLNLVWFKGTQLGNHIKLEWRITRGADPVAFEIERSLNGRNFTTVGQLSRTNQDTYTWNDNVEKLGASRVYYRIRLKYSQKADTYSDIYSTHLQGDAKYTVFPDVTANRVWVDFGTKTFTGQITLVNMSGMRLAQMNVDGMTGRFSLPTPILATGKYMVVLTDKKDNVKPVSLSFGVLR